MSGFRKPFRAVPLHDRDGNEIPFREPRKGTMTDRIFGSAKLFGSSRRSKKARIVAKKAAQQGERSARIVRRKGRLHSQSSRVGRGGWLGFAVLAVSLSMIVFGLALRFGGPFIEDNRPASALEMPVAGPQDTLSARFATCDGPVRGNCVVDGDTFWFAGEKYRVLDINTPEISTPQCDAELALGRAATDRLRQLLNAGPFSLESGDEETDRYGRKLRRITRGGRSLGDILVEEGLAERWQGFRRSWC